MSFYQFWEDDPGLVVFYRKANVINKRRMNEQLWLTGIYVSEALLSTVGNMFSKGNKHRYPIEPLPITREEQEERKEREERARMEKLKATFTARALSLNAKRRVQNDGAREAANT